MEELLREDTTNANEIVDREKEYFMYIRQHNANVNKAFYNLFYSKKDTISTSKFTNEELRSSIEKVVPEIKNHDMSKYSDEEFEAYRKHWYPTKDEKSKMVEDEAYRQKVEDDYQKAWVHHYSINNHHPEYWKIENTQNPEVASYRDMDLGAIIHMISDWVAMDYFYHGNTIEWYENDEKNEYIKTKMSDNTREALEDILYTVCSR